MGRPRQFCKDQALDHAMQLFWSKGFQATTLADLTAAMGINAPSLYAAFGNKEALFEAVLDRYFAGPAQYLKHALQQPTARATAEFLWRGAVGLGTCPDNPAGCLWVRSLLSCGLPTDLHKRLLQQQTEAKQQVAERFTRALADGDLPPATDCKILAESVFTFSFGLSVQATTGATRTQLDEVIRLALAAFPTTIS